MTNRIQPLVALRALRQLVRDPEDTSKVFEIIAAMAGNSNAESAARFEQTLSGQRILAAKTSLLDSLRARDALQAMSADSLGRAYLHFLESENLSADGLVEASQTMQASRLHAEVDQNQQHFNLRQRDQHDLWHVVTGYGRDIAGEASLLAFTYAQTRNRGLGVIALVGGLKLTKRYGWSIFKSLWQGYRLGKRAAWLPQQEWETLLQLPLLQVRDLLKIGRPDTYFGLSSASNYAFTERTLQP